MGAKNTIIGLDIGTHSVKAVWCDAQGKRLTITRCELFRLPESGVAANVLQPWAEQHGLRKFPCVLALPGQKCIFQPFASPAEDPRSLGQIAAIEVLKFNEMASDDMLYAHVPFSLGGSERRMLLAMARPGVVNETLALADALKLQVIDLVPSPVAVFHSLRSPSAPPTEVAAHIHIGRATTDLAVGRGAELVFARTFASGGQSFTDALARQLSLSPAQAETFKTTRGTVVGDTREAKALASAGQMWVNEVASCLAMYRSLFAMDDAQPSSVTLSGPAAVLDGLNGLLARRLSLPVRLIDRLPGGLQGPKSHVMAPAAGLAVLGRESPDTHLSLLPRRLRDELAFRRSKPHWIGACVAGALILGVSVAGGYKYSNDQKRLLKAQSESLARRQALVSQIEAQKNRIERLLKLADPVKNLIYTGKLMRELITLIAESTAPTDWITLIADSEAYFTPERFNPDAEPDGRSSARELRRRAAAFPAGATPPAEASVFERVIVEGYTRDRTMKTVDELLGLLRKSKFIVKADLLPDDRIPRAAPSEAPGAIRFVIELEVVTR